MIRLETFKRNDFLRLIGWIGSERELIQFAGAIFTFPLTENQLSEYINNKSLRPKTIVDIDSGEVIGHCELNFLNEFPRLSRILIGNKDYRGKGLGKQLIALVIVEIQKVKPTDKVELRVFDWNKNALKLYENTGFSIVPEATLEFEFKNEIWTNLYMSKQLN